MQTTVLTHDEIERLVNGNARLRLRADDSRWLLRRGTKYLVISGELNEDRLRQYLTVGIREEYGNPVVIWILLHIILPVIIKLLIEWWLNRNTEV